ncbi:hypothetical protein PG995_003931 [Apiospora arundinis]
MKVSTTLCTLGLYTLALGAPTPVPNDKEFTIPTTSLKDVLSKFSVADRLSIKDFIRQHAGNHPVGPSDVVSPPEAPAMHRPLSISQLLSSPSRSDSQSPIPEMEQSSTVRAEAGFISKTNPTTVEEEVAGSKRLYRFMPCHKNHGGKQQFHLVRQYADMVVVGVLAVFLMAVAIVELWTPVSGRLRQWRNNEGAIRLGDEEKTPIEPMSSPETLRSSVPQQPSTPATL